MRVAVVGSGVAGLVCADRLAREHEVTLFEADERPGGHVNTVDVDDGGRTIAVDTGFIVFNERTYPNFVALLRELGVAWKPSDMSFSVKSERTGLEYNGTSLNALFAQRSNALRPSFWRMVRDILRFYREAGELLGEGEEEALGSYLERKNYSEPFVRDHLIPMGAAIWSATPENMLRFPARTLVRFFHNHGFLQVDGRPQWLVVSGGSREWVRALLARFAGRLRTGTPVRGLRREGGRVVLSLPEGPETFDRVVLATHSDQALRMLSDATPLEREVLSKFGYQENRAYLHNDARLLPRRPLARAAWNVHQLEPPARLATVTYWMNRLQGFESREPWLVSLNVGDRVDASKVVREIVYHHPVYTKAAVEAQRRHADLNGSNGVYFAGAYWGYGFHEDGVNSALAVCRDLEREAVHA